jgi:hypothetical protein
MKDLDLIRKHINELLIVVETMQKNNSESLHMTLALQSIESSLIGTVKLIDFMRQVVG